MAVERSLCGLDEENNPDHNVPSLPRAPAAPSPWLPPAWGTGPAALPELPSLPEEHSGHPFLSLSSRCLSLSVTRESIRALPAHVLAVEVSHLSPEALSSSPR